MKKEEAARSFGIKRPIKKETKMSEATATKEELKAQKEQAKAEAKAAKLAERKAAKEAVKAERANQPRKERNSMAKGWGAVFAQAAAEGKDQAWVEAEMIARYPEKVETIKKWTLWYKNFYNMGKIKGFESPVRVEWPKAARTVSPETLAKREAKAQAKEAAKAEKAALKEQARQEKLAAKEAAKAQKQEQPA